MPRTEPFAAELLRWFDIHGRRDLPWQSPRTPYRVWLSEIMLQQTQVATVVPYFLRFVEKFASTAELAAAPVDDVLASWSGLGYYSRARNLHKAATICVEQHHADLPKTFDRLAALPGIGRSTAGAILAQAHGMKFPILDGNVKRVLARFHGVRGWSGSTAAQNQLWKFAESHTPDSRMADYTQAIMDLGATVCTRTKPRCTECPLSDDCIALHDGLTATLPESKPRRALPTRTTMMLILRDASGRLLLERRPPVGVWAELWSLPEADDIESAKLGAAFVHAHDDIVFRHLQPFTHTFSHYRLDVTPLAFDVCFKAHIADDSNRRWVSPTEAAQLGLPAPVRKLIENLDKDIP
ncbi:MAG TPA: A/G-specific adenine glycosylase [Rudaea sp.]|jgi:A/G-specific adenine glycosylase|nr:A/G-specific adenine glycosylase [Rudaea sp.]